MQVSGVIDRFPTPLSYKITDTPIPRFRHCMTDLRIHTLEVSFNGTIMVYRDGWDLRGAIPEGIEFVLISDLSNKMFNKQYNNSICGFRQRRLMILYPTSNDEAFIIWDVETDEVFSAYATTDENGIVNLEVSENYVSLVSQAGITRTIEIYKERFNV